MVRFSKSYFHGVDAILLMKLSLTSDAHGDVAMSPPPPFPLVRTTGHTRCRMTAKDFRNRAMGMNFLVAGGTSAAYVYSVVLLLLAVSTAQVCRTLARPNRPCAQAIDRVEKKKGDSHAFTRYSSYRGIADYRCHATEQIRHNVLVLLLLVQLLTGIKYYNFYFSNHIRGVVDGAPPPPWCGQCVDK